MVSFFPPYFLFDYIRKKYLFALHGTSESLITVSCCSSLEFFHLLEYCKYFVSLLPNLLYEHHLHSVFAPFVFFPSFYLIFMSWRHCIQGKLPKISNHLPNPFFVFSVSATALEETKQVSSVFFLNYLIKNFNLLS